MDISIYDNKQNEVTIIKVGITKLNLLTQVDNKKSKKYNMLTK